MRLAKRALAAAIYLAAAVPAGAQMIYGKTGARAVMVVHQDFSVEQGGSAQCGEMRKAYLESAEYEHNRYRLQHGLKPFSQNDVLSKLASVHACDMARRGTVTHRSHTGLRAGQRADIAGYGWRRIGENVGARADSVSEVVAAWIASPGHRSNIMDRKMREFGLGWASSGDGRTMYWAAIYADPRP